MSLTAWRLRLMKEKRPNFPSYKIENESEQSINQKKKKSKANKRRKQSIEHEFYDTSDITCHLFICKARHG